MEEAKGKKEIVVKRLSAFKFAVEVNNEAEEPARVSVIQRAPPATSTVAPVKNLILREVIMHRIVEMLLWKLLGEERLRKYCGYPSVPLPTLLCRVVKFSAPNGNTGIKQDHICEEEGCFLEHVVQFLNICAPTQELWSRFGWCGLSEEAILRKIYEEELSPSFRRAAKIDDSNIENVWEDVKLLMHWEDRGYTAVEWTGKKFFSKVVQRAPEYKPKVHIQNRDDNQMSELESFHRLNNKFYHEQEMRQQYLNRLVYPHERWHSRTPLYRIYRPTRTNNTRVGEMGSLHGIGGVRLLHSSNKMIPYEHSINGLLSRK